MATSSSQGRALYEEMNQFQVLPSPSADMCQACGDKAFAVTFLGGGQQRQVHVTLGELPGRCAAAVSFFGPVPITYLDTEGGVHT